MIEIEQKHERAELLNSIKDRQLTELKAMLKEAVFAASKGGAKEGPFGELTAAQCPLGDAMKANEYGVLHSMQWKMTVFIGLQAAFFICVGAGSAAVA